MNTTLKISRTLVAGLSLASVLAIASTAVQADDIGPDKALALRDQGAILAFDKLNNLALAQHPGGRIGDTELEEAWGRYVYQVEVLDAQGQEWDLELNAATGELLRNERDD
ncbi:Peptidase propeptide and YPEB domain protein [Cellvibrio japonicus Ueda107]|uniref:Peptidase propeptide and YPEB domain protein n=2 Tax=Cellvibrio japonicus TaxID=155077 RepID=B3PFM1_CELJU|nr:Peptidase propeptide and YPEB domain protein [Cellvibrio japonicus Ueda107]QEI14017.1 peptidase [Cellvibrio japonicus]QEI17591.1 peptidase [Cellvibrio japonicus]QEI21166.1 peptidase [Cellvibrio japonicus]